MKRWMLSVLVFAVTAPQAIGINPVGRSSPPSHPKPNQPVRPYPAGAMPSPGQQQNSDLGLGCCGRHAIPDGRDEPNPEPVDRDRRRDRDGNGQS